MLRKLTTNNGITLKWKFIWNCCHNHNKGNSTWMQFRVLLCSSHWSLNQWRGALMRHHAHHDVTVMDQVLRHHMPSLGHNKLNYAWITSWYLILQFTWWLIKRLMCFCALITPMWLIILQWLFISVRSIFHTNDLNISKQYPFVISYKLCHDRSF